MFHPHRGKPGAKDIDNHAPRVGLWGAGRPDGPNPAGKRAEGQPRALAPLTLECTIDAPASEILPKGRPPLGRGGGLGPRPRRQQLGYVREAEGARPDADAESPFGRRQRLHVEGLVEHLGWVQERVTTRREGRGRERSARRVLISPPP